MRRGFRWPQTANSKRRGYKQKNKSGAVSDGFRWLAESGAAQTKKNGAVSEDDMAQKASDRSYKVAQLQTVSENGAVPESGAATDGL